MGVAVASRRAGSRRAVAVLMIGAALVLALATACASSPPGAPASPTSVAEPFASAHPDGALPPGLSPAAGVRLRPDHVRRASGVRIVLAAGWLPPGYWIAAPYVSVGDGSALPNPHTWRGGYRVSYTDGAGLIVLHVGNGRLPGEGAWRPLARRWRDVGLWRREADGLVTVAARRRAVPVAVAVMGLPEAVALRVLAGLQEARQPWYNRARHHHTAVIAVRGRHRGRRGPVRASPSQGAGLARPAPVAAHLGRRR